jgi:5-methyltetrahydrofolate--homocysteine methyltransferase
MSRFLNAIKKKILIYDGSKGYMLQHLGLSGNECSESWNLTNGDKVRQVYRMYKEAGSDVIQTNTFPGNRVFLEKFGLDAKTYDINYVGTKIAREVMGEDGIVASSAGPTGILFEPFGAMNFIRAYNIFKEQVQAFADGGADLINFETFTDIAEIRAALIAARDICSLPVICSFAFEKSGRTLMGNSPEIIVAIMDAMGAEMIGANCSSGADQLLHVIKSMHAANSGAYLCVKPNAGLPEYADGIISYREKPSHFASFANEYTKNGVRLIGGCCGTTPEFIRELKAAVDTDVASPPIDKKGIMITSSEKMIDAGDLSVLKILNITGKSSDGLFSDIRNGDFQSITEKAYNIAESDYNAIYLNPENEAGENHQLAGLISKLQETVKIPFILETADPAAMESALQEYAGIAGVVVKPGSNDSKLRKTATKYSAVIVDYNT